MNLPSKSLE